MPTCCGSKLDASSHTLPQHWPQVTSLQHQGMHTWQLAHMPDLEADALDCTSSIGLHVRISICQQLDQLLNPAQLQDQLHIALLIADVQDDIGRLSCSSLCQAGGREVLQNSSNAILAELLPVATLSGEDLKGLQQG